VAVSVSVFKTAVSANSISSPFLVLIPRLIRRVADEARGHRDEMGTIHFLKRLNKYLDNSGEAYGNTLLC
jgi:hypothetical protein